MTNTYHVNFAYTKRKKYKNQKTEQQRTDAVPRGVDDVIQTARNPIITILVALGTISSEIVAYVHRTMECEEYNSKQLNNRK